MESWFATTRATTPESTDARASRAVSTARTPHTRARYSRCDAITSTDATVMTESWRRNCDGRPASEPVDAPGTRSVTHHATVTARTSSASRIHRSDRTATGASSGGLAACRPRRHVVRRPVCRADQRGRGDVRRVPMLHPWIPPLATFSRHGPGGHFRRRRSAPLAPLPPEGSPFGHPGATPPVGLLAHAPDPRVPRRPQ